LLHLLRHQLVAECMMPLMGFDAVMWMVIIVVDRIWPIVLVEMDGLFPTDVFVYDGLDLKRESEEGRGYVVLGSLLIFILDAFGVVAST